jgi:hypothetical protein
MTSVEQCRANAAEYKKLGANPKNSARRSAVLKSISRSWTALAHQLESLALIEKSEGDGTDTHHGASLRDPARGPHP